VEVLGSPTSVTCTVGYQAVGTKIRASIVYQVIAGSGPISNTITLISANSSNSPSATVSTTVN
jgi:hypothetical protein